jgi:hypothetical protein
LDETGAQTQTPKNLCTDWLFIMDVLKSSAHRVTKHLKLYPYKITAIQKLMMKVSTSSLLHEI